MDEHLADGVPDEDVDRWVRTAAVLHSNGDGMDIAVRDGRIVGVRGRADDRVNHGRLGPKDGYGWQANNSADRLTVPLVRREGRLVESTWDEAMGLVVRRGGNCSRSRARAPWVSTRAGSCSPRSKWTNAMLKTLSPQVLVS